MDNLGGFLQDKCKKDPNGKVTVKDLYMEYTSWAEETGERPMSQRMLGQRLSERGYEQGRDMVSRYWNGLGLQK